MQEAPAFLDGNFLSSLMHVPSAVCVLEGPSHIYRFANIAYQQMVGEMPLLGRALLDARPELQGSKFLRLLNDTLRNNCPVTQKDAFAQIPDGKGNTKEFYCDFSYTPWLDDSGHAKGVFVVIINTQERVVYQKQSETRLKMLQALMDTLPHAVFLVTQEQKLLFCNKRWEEYTAQTAQTLTRDSWRSLVHPDDNQKMAESWYRAARNKDKFEACVRVRHAASGQYRWQKMVGMPFADEGIGEMCWIGTWTDVDEEIRQQHQINADTEAYIATVGHDLRSPLCAIRVNAESMSRKMPSSMQKDKLERIIKTVQRVDDMLGELLHFNTTNVRSAQQKGQPDADLAIPLALSIENFQGRYGNRFITQVPLHMTGTWLSDAMVRAIDNLIENAFKYGSETGPVTLRVWLQDGIWRLQVHNTGNPIATAEQQNIFALHARGKDPKALAQPGFGLGLSQVRNVAFAHHGSIEVQSDLVHGTTFTLSIPQTGCTTDKDVCPGTSPVSFPPLLWRGAMQHNEPMAAPLLPHF